MNKQIVSSEHIALRIRLVRGRKVLLDSDLARLYGVTTGNLNKAVNRRREIGFHVREKAPRYRVRKRA
jgi:hypothetical protein